MRSILPSEHYLIDQLANTTSKAQRLIENNPDDLILIPKLYQDWFLSGRSSCPHMQKVLCYHENHTCHWTMTVDISKDAYHTLFLPPAPPFQKSSSASTMNIPYLYPPLTNSDTRTLPSLQYAGIPLHQHAWTSLPSSPSLTFLPCFMTLPSLLEIFSLLLQTRPPPPLFLPFCRKYSPLFDIPSIILSGTLPLYTIFAC